MAKGLTSKAALQASTASYARTKKIKPSSFKGVLNVTFDRRGSKRTLSRRALKNMSAGRRVGLTARYRPGLSSGSKRRQLVMRLSKWAAV